MSWATCAKYAPRSEHANTRCANGKGRAAVNSIREECYIQVLQIKGRPHFGELRGGDRLNRNTRIGGRLARLRGRALSLPC